MPKLKPRRVPLSVYIVQVVLYCLLSILNNKAFSYLIPMPVHIVFRSGSPIISMLMGRIFLRKRSGDALDSKPHYSPIFQIYNSTGSICGPRDSGSHIYHPLWHK